MAAAPLKSPVRSAGRGEVHVAAVPLRATKGPAQLLASAAYSLKLWDFQHFMVIVRTSLHCHPILRKLTKLPTERCWFVGSCGEHALEVAYKLNNPWETNLKIGHHDCRNYTNGLVEHLTGEKHVLKRLRRNSGDLH